MPRFLASLVLLGSVVALTLPASADDAAHSAVAPVASYTLTTDKRTLRELPLKRLVTSAEG